MEAVDDVFFLSLSHVSTNDRRGVLSLALSHSLSLDLSHSLALSHILALSLFRSLGLSLLLFVSSQLRRHRWKLSTRASEQTGNGG